MKPRIGKIHVWSFCHVIASLLAFAVALCAFYQIGIYFTGTPGTVESTYTSWNVQLGFEYVGAGNIFDTASNVLGGWLMPISSMFKYLINAAGVTSSDVGYNVWRVIGSFAFGFDAVLWVNILLLILHLMLFIPFASYHFFKEKY